VYREAVCTATTSIGSASAPTMDDYQGICTAGAQSP
jgi:hypothetical protein